MGLRDRLRTAGRVGTWTGAILGLFAFIMATAGWSESVTVAGEEVLRPVLVADSRSVMIAVALISVLFGALVASFARAAASWVNPAMQLSSSKSATAWTGALIGLVLGAGAGALLTNGFGTPIEGSEGLVELPVLATLAVMLVGGAALGWITTVATQFFGVPIAVEANDQDEVQKVRSRLKNAVGIPMAGLIILAVLVLPFAWALIESNGLISGGGSIIAILTAAGILGFAALAGNKPNVRIGKGELLVAVLGIALVVIIVFAVLNNMSSGEPEEEVGDEAGISVLIV